MPAGPPVMAKRNPTSAHLPAPGFSFCGAGPTFAYLTGKPSTKPSESITDV
jgi:hypothetical protein